MGTKTDFDEARLRRLLSAMAVQPRLRSLLLFDASRTRLDFAAATLAAILEAAFGVPARQVWLGSHHDQDALWGLGTDLLAPWRRIGLLAPADAAESEVSVVVIPDLTILSLTVARACVEMVDAEVTHLERHGQSRRWRSRQFWLAACPRSGTSQVSPHLLDRFVLRFASSPPIAEGRTSELRSFLDDRYSRPPEDEQTSDLDSKLASSLKRALEAPVDVTDDVLEGVVTTLASRPAPGWRRHLTLSRLAVALARLDGQSEVVSRHLEEAARLLGLELVPRTTRPPVVHQAPEPQPQRPRRVEPAKPAPAPSPQPEPRTEPSASIETEVPRPRVQSVIEASLSPYPEDTAPVEREFASLQFPLTQNIARAQNHGVPIGVRHATGVADLALVPTIFTAAPYQPIRRRNLGRHGRALILSADDLRSWRRTPAAEEMLALLLDVTSYGASDWLSAIVPYVREAYVRRAALCLVLVGAAETADELRAERLLARSVLAPELRTALERRPGRASPLAHGLERVLDTLRKMLHQGRSSISQARLVVISDGRGNVPLEASRGKRVGPVCREGIDDALAVARKIADLNGVESIVLDPQPRHVSHLPRDLAAALGARLEAIPERSLGETQE